MIFNYRNGRKKYISSFLPFSTYDVCIRKNSFFHDNDTKNTYILTSFIPTWDIFFKLFPLIRDGSF